MEFAKGLLQAYRKRWDYVNAFSVQFQLSPWTKKVISASQYIESKEINLNIVSIDTPQFTNQNVEIFVANQWKIHNGRDELYRFSVTFRDEEQMSLYKAFVKMYQSQYTRFFDEIAMNVSIYKDADYHGQTDKAVFHLENVMVDSVSQVQFNNTTENQIAEFTVQFKCTMPIVGRD